MIQYVNSAIDTVSGAKTSFLDTFVTEKSLNEPLKALVDAQASFAKIAVKSIYDFTTAAGEQIQKFDFSQFTKTSK